MADALRLLRERSERGDGQYGRRNFRLDAGHVQLRTHSPKIGWPGSPPGDVVGPQYQGMEWDAHVELFNTAGRFYDSIAGRFISVDSSGWLSGAKNLYTIDGGVAGPANMGRPGSALESKNGWEFFWELYEPDPTILGVAQAVGGLGEVLGGCAATLTGVGLFVCLHGLDDIRTGFMTAYTGEFQESLTHKLVYAATSNNTLANVVDIGAGLASGAAAARIAKANAVVQAPRGADDLVTVYRGMGQPEFNALSSGGPLHSPAQIKSAATKPSLLQKYFRHSIDSSSPPSSFVSVTQSQGAARHFIIEGMPKGFRGALKDLAIRSGISKPVVADGKILAEITLRRSDLSRTLHFAQDELVALGGTRVHSIRAVANPAMQSRLSWRVYAGAFGQVAVIGGVPVGVAAGGAYLYERYSE